MKPNRVEFEPPLPPSEDWGAFVAEVSSLPMPTDAELDQLPAFVGQARDLFPEGVELHLAKQRPPYDGTPLVHTRILS
ncbi:MAG: hypothetical protein KIH63_000675 [Candidatus Saccharibacteria bacterium]|nr:hypothetical protein [Candidatus Saccharibacteria bacterium]